MARRYGRAPRGERVVAAIPHGHWKTTTFIAALRHDRITAPYVFDGTINGARFLAWVQQALVPTRVRRPASARVRPTGARAPDLCLSLPTWIKCTRRRVR